MFRRPIRRAVRIMTINAVEQNEFYRANQLFQIGQYESAAVEYVQLAQRLERTGKPRQAANMHAQAALAWAKAGIEHRASHQANIAFSQFTLLGMKQRITEFKTQYEQAVHPDSTNQNGNTTSSLAEHPRQPVTDNAGDSHHERLPSTCPHCGAPVRSTEIEWLDAQSAECDFCGAILQAE